MKFLQRSPEVLDPSLALVARMDSATNLLEDVGAVQSADLFEKDLDRKLQRLIRSTKKLIMEHGLLVADCKSDGAGEGGARLRLEHLWEARARNDGGLLYHINSQHRYGQSCDSPRSTEDCRERYVVAHGKKWPDMLLNSTDLESDWSEDGSSRSASVLSVPLKGSGHESEP